MQYFRRGMARLDGMTPTIFFSAARVPALADLELQIPPKFKLPRAAPKCEPTLDLDDRRFLQEYYRAALLTD
jgi:hypothetical protein